LGRSHRGTTSHSTYFITANVLMKKLEERCELEKMHGFGSGWCVVGDLGSRFGGVCIFEKYVPLVGHGCEKNVRNC